MAAPPTPVGDVEAVEEGTKAIQRITKTGREQRLSSTNCRERSWTVANRKIACTARCGAECLSRFAWSSSDDRAVLAQSAETPYADPHVRCCGRGEWATTPPMPIGPFGIYQLPSDNIC